MINEDIAKMVLVEGKSIKDAAEKYHLSNTGARSRLHTYCRTMAPGTYKMLMHTNTYADGHVNDGCLPYLSVLRKHQALFFNDKPVAGAYSTTWGRKFSDWLGW